SYNRYSAIRGGGAGQTAGGIALAKAALTPTLLNPTQALPDNRQYALHPAMGGLAQLFNNGKAAVQLNVGPLVVPLTRAQYNSADRKAYPLPPKLFSHNDQQSVWQSSSPEGSTVGWGGNLGDLALSSNGNSLFTCISVTGNAVYLSGDAALQYQVSTGGAIAINGVKNNV
ncbi:MAG TPA: Tat pathway signal protein, partial [Comamonadaceae bacterium]|nr:Tat pathway signal protein [Comamonadaceae bacterium]